MFRITVPALASQTALGAHNVMYRPLWKVLRVPTPDLLGICQSEVQALISHPALEVLKVIYLQLQPVHHQTAKAFLGTCQKIASRHAFQAALNALVALRHLQPPALRPIAIVKVMHHQLSRVLHPKVI
mmetsp:Transcript_903/g.1994  ORF Transcript_903/g.1994 Transcript_903/m.1994 type:complete len:128 (-) Transcript_903:1617-2000(-)